MATPHSSSDKIFRVLGARLNCGPSPWLILSESSYPVALCGYSNSARSIYLWSQMFCFIDNLTLVPMGSPAAIIGRWVGVGIDITGKGRDSPWTTAMPVVREPVLVEGIGCCAVSRGSGVGGGCED